MIGQQDMYLTPENNQKEQAVCQDDPTVKKVLKFQKSKEVKATERPRSRGPQVKRQVVCHTFELPILSICLLLLIGLASAILYSDYQRKVASLQQNLVDLKEQCRLNYTANMCDDKTLRAQRDFCFRQKLCMERNTTEELQRKVKGAGIVGEIVRDFVDSLGYYGLIVLVLMTYSVFNKHGNGHRFFRKIVEKEYYQNDF